MPHNKTFRTVGFSRKFLLTACAPAIGGVLWLASCAPSPSDNTTENDAGTTASGANSLVAKPTPVKKAAAPQGPPYTLFLPNADAMLTKQVVRDTKTDAVTTYEQKAGRALAMLFIRLEFLPKHAKLLVAPKKDKNGVVHLNFSRQFLQLDTAPDTAVLLILDAISRTLGALEPSGQPAKVLIVVEGKSVGEFNEFTLAEPWLPAEGDEVSNDKSDDSQSSGNKTTDNSVSDDSDSDDKATEEKPGGGV